MFNLFSQSIRIDVPAPLLGFLAVLDGPLRAAVQTGETLGTFAFCPLGKPVVLHFDHQARTLFGAKSTAVAVDRGVEWAGAAASLINRITQRRFEPAPDAVPNGRGLTILYICCYSRDHALGSFEHSFCLFLRGEQVEQQDIVVRQINLESPVEPDVPFFESLFEHDLRVAAITTAGKYKVCVVIPIALQVEPGYEVEYDGRDTPKIDREDKADAFVGCWRECQLPVVEAFVDRYRLVVCYLGEFLRHVLRVSRTRKIENHIILV